MKKQSSKTDNISTKAILPSKKGIWIPLLVIIIAVLCCYSPSFSDEKEFTNWDDPGYVTNQSLIQSFDSEKVDSLFNTSTQVMLNYHPLTMLTLAYNYSKTELDISSYMQWNLALHILNALLVFFFIYFLSKKNLFIAFFTAIWFGIHPMHVESVAWISERKDVLYTFFFLLSLLSYQYYLNAKKVWILFFVFILFIASCLSKAMAVPLPIVLLLLDYYYNRKFNFRSIIEKVPFFLVALFIGTLAWKIQGQGAIAKEGVFTIVQQVMFASYGFMMYWVKLFLPVDLSAFYPYPALGPENELPVIFYMAPLLVSVLVLAPAIILWRKKSPLLKPVVFGMGFFLIMVALVLQFISVGSAIMADRYTYIPYIGAFFLILSALAHFKVHLKYKAISYTILGIFTCFLAKQCYDRVPIWTNSETLWSDVISKYPFVIDQQGNKVKIIKNGVEVAYKNRGNYYREHNQMKLAFNDYNTLVMARVKEPLIYSNMANMYALEAKFDKAMEMYGLAIERNNSNYETYLNRGITYSKMGNRKASIADFRKASQLLPNNIQIMSNLASELLNDNQFEETIKLSEKLIKLSPSGYEGYFYRGTALINQKKYPEGIKELLKSVAINPTYSFTNYNLSVAYSLINDRAKALFYAEKAKTQGYPVTDNFLASLKQ
jgi:tetratricopeptide (TPR) repeat protein